MIENIAENFSENLFQKLEEKTLMLLAEIEMLRKENTTLKIEKEKYLSEKSSHEKKLRTLLSLIDPEQTDNVMHNISAVKPVLVQG